MLAVAAHAGVVIPDFQGSGITLVEIDWTTSTTPVADDNNTTLLGGVEGPFSLPENSPSWTSHALWNKRSNVSSWDFSGLTAGTGSYALVGHGYNTAADLAHLTTSHGVPTGTYDVYIIYVDNNSNFDGGIAAGLSGGAIAEYHDSDADVDFGAAPGSSDPAWQLYGVKLGQQTGTTLSIDIGQITENLRNMPVGLGFVATDPDTDMDGLSDIQEISGSENPFGPNDPTLPNNPDSDGDGVSDGDEVFASPPTDPNDAASFPPVPPNVLEVAPDGVWTWFNDERAIWHLGKLYAGYVKSNGQYGITRYDPSTGTSSNMIISTSASQQRDDHNNPSITVLPDNTLFIAYSRHSTQDRYFFRTSLVTEPASASDWGPEQARDITGGLQNTYANAFHLDAEPSRIYLLHRYINLNPTLSISDDNGASFGDPVQLISKGTNSYPYPRYSCNNTNRFDFIYTDGHPRANNNSVYHLYYQSGVGGGAGSFKQTDGTVLRTLTEILDGNPIDHDAGERGTLVYPFNPDPWNATTPEGPDAWIPGGRAWSWDVERQTNGNPVCAFQVRVGEVTGSNWFDDRIYYYYARWDGTQWERHFIAQGGRPIYSAERDYGGGIAIDPDNPDVVYIASNHADPTDILFTASGVSNNALSTSKRYEIYRGVTLDGGATFKWSAVTTDSGVDNLRPIVPENHGFDRHALWFSGNYTTFTTYSAKVVGLFENDLKISSFSIVGNDVTLDWDSSPSRSYSIKGSITLDDGFPYDAATGVSAEGGSTSHTFSLPTSMREENKGFFQIQQ